MDIKLTDEDIKIKVTALVAELNNYIRSGKYLLFKDDAKYLFDKYARNELMLAGCKLHNAISTEYIELPYNEIKESQINSIIYTTCRLLGIMTEIEDND